MSLAAYRHLLRSARLAFQGDVPALTAAHTKIRAGFEEKAALSPSDAAVPDAIQNATDISRILRENVVQGRKDGDKYKLRIHEHIERGDNDTIKTTGGCGGGCGGKA